MKPGIFRTLCLSLPLLGTLLTGAPAAADQYPNRPVTLVVPYPAGGSTDELARILGRGIESSLGQPVVVVNRAGASGAIAASSVAKSAADGYTLLLVSGVQMSVNPLLMKDLSYDPAKDFSPIIYATSMPSVVVVNPKFPVQEASELVGHLKSNPDRFNYASASVGTPSHLGVEMFKKVTGTSIQHIPYKGGAPALIDLVAGEVSMMFAYIPEALPYIQTDRLRPLAVTTRERSSLLPDVPTLIEAGIDDYELLGYFGIVAPTGTPSDRVELLNKHFNEALRRDEVRSHLNSKGFITVGGTPEEFSRYIDSETKKWASILQSQ